MPLRACLILLPFLLGLIAGRATASPVGRVELELVGSAQQGSPLAFQEWLQALSRAGIRNVRLRAAQEIDKVGIEVRGTDESPVYVVTGVLSAKDEIVLPGARFRRNEVRRLAQWLDDLARRGPPDRREAVSAFGLTAKQLTRVHDELAKPVGFSTKGVGRLEAIEKIGRQLGLPLQIEGALSGGSEKIEEELSELSCGTALACILRPVGFGLFPRAAEERLSLGVAPSQLDKEVWPIGWPPEKPQGELLPALYEFRNVNVQGVTAAQVLAAIGQRIKAPVLLDYNALARHGIEPEKAPVAHPQLRTNYSTALRKMLVKVGMKFEVRVDEAGRPFLWVSSVKPV